jgi:hypothetical protein
VKYFKEASELWKAFVPSTGQAETVQGELVRAVEKLRDEAQRNGNMNWDDGHEILAAFLRDTLVRSGTFDKAACAEIEGDVAHLRDYEQSETRDEPFDRLTDRVVEWSRAHPEPVPHALNLKLHR